MPSNTPTVAEIDPTPAITMLDLPISVQRHILRYLDFPSLMTLRCLNRNLLILGTAELKSNLHELLRHYLANPDDFVEHMKNTYAYIGGHVALEWFQRVQKLSTQPLQLFTPRHSFTSLIIHLQKRQCLNLIGFSDCVPQNAGFTTSARLSGPFTEIIVYRSSDDSPLTPLVRGACTALMCYIGAHRYGVLWPRLTFAHRGLVSQADIEDPDYNSTIGLGDFDFKLFPWMWPEYSEKQTCLRQHFLCPSQPRFLDDNDWIHVRVTGHA
ncbi:hypothetical protein FKP32DRAFT_1678151 [Trametes sanguinea]|nr:hypothetical protein FKP32DRAFT_1678151 [Trametes sanguinea]